MQLKFSRKAEIDLEEIEAFSVATFGVLVGQDYVRSLREACNLLTVTPDMGSAFEYNDREYRRFPKESHLLIYRRSGDDLLIVRILHKSQKRIL
ncbi:MAG: type II toxin-antitoxin system RelE/ParE family toxin [Pseudomonadota bacterium]